jgi:hypothetical protein
MHHSDFISILASIYKPNVYVELGLYEGETINKVMPFVKRIYGVELKRKPQLDLLQQNYPNLYIHYTYTDTFFENFNEGIDMIFIDADHCFDSALKDFENALKLLNPGGIIILHDTDPSEDWLIDPGYCGDSYRIVSLLEKRDDINILTLPLDSPGLSIVTKKSNTRVQLRDITR